MVSNFDIRTFHSGDQFDHLRAEFTVWNDEEQRFECVSMNGKKRFEGYQYTNRSLDEVITPINLARKIKFGRVMQQMGENLYTFAEENPDIAAATTLIDAFGKAHFAASKRGELSIPVIVAVAGCLGVMIKDDEGNVTAAHVNPMQRYNLLTVRNLLIDHFRVFGKCPHIRLAVTGMLGTQSNGNEEDEDTELMQPSFFHPFSKEALDTMLEKGFSNVDFSVTFHTQQQLELNSLTTYDTGTTTSPEENIQVRKHVMPFHS